MIDSLRSIKSQVRALRAYSLSPHRASIKINQNENPFDAPPVIKEETLRRLEKRKWSRYPDFIPVSLQERLADFSSWQRDGVIAGNGSNELIQALLMVTIGEGKRVLISEPTFALYRQVTTVLGGEVISVPQTREFQFDVESLAREIEQTQPDVVILCSPNNPTGCVLGLEDLRRLLSIAPGLVVIDEAYHEFAQRSAVPLLNEFDRLVVLRTFSKAMALAALRVGYFLASPKLVTEIRKAVLPYNLNAFSQTAAEVAVDLYEAELLPLVRAIISERERLFQELKKIQGLTPIKSEANFMIAKTTVGPKQVFDELIKKDILVRDVSSYPMLSEYFRISVGTPEENDLLVEAMGAILS
ncbi:MAG TPA: histidinol-phosphate transaminase [Pyrinomonadaceae bacterium]|jgi:histidinol-phosphate aminotransferase|nr:histidinol-phosphate transaminase [Pyrinomonadaceae bacterium]